MKLTKLFGLPLRAVLMLALAAVAGVAQAAGVDVQGFIAQNAGAIAGMSVLGFMGEVDGTAIMKALEGVEKKLTAISEKADGEMKELGKVSTDTKTAIDAIGVEQRVLADRLLLLEQKGGAPGKEEKADESWGAQFVKNAKYADFAGGQMNKLRVEVKNTLTGSDANVAPDRKPNIVGGAFLPMTMESLIPATTTSSNAIEFTKEASFTNSAAEAAARCGCAGAGRIRQYPYALRRGSKGRPPTGCR
jgi:hypothetical protein